MTYTTVLSEMFETRGYTDAAIETDFEYFRCCMFDGKDRVYVFDDPSEKLSVGTVKECVSFMNNEGSLHAIIIYGSAFTPIVRKIVDTDISIRIELFSRSELGYNITKHVLVPTHARATTEERAQIEQYADKIPRLLATDAVARFHGFTPGEIIRVNRPNGTVVFRTVI